MVNDEGINGLEAIGITTRLAGTGRHMK